MTQRKARTTGNKPDKLMRDAIILALHREAKDADGAPTKKLVLIANRLVDKAVAGEMAAIREVINRVDGKKLIDVAATALALEDFLDRLDGSLECS